MADLPMPCACKSHDARDCIRIRYPKFICDDCDDDLDYETERCECACHDESDYDPEDFLREINELANQPIAKG